MPTTDLSVKSPKGLKTADSGSECEEEEEDEDDNAGDNTTFKVNLLN